MHCVNDAVILRHLFVFECFFHIKQPKEKKYDSRKYISTILLSAFHSWSGYIICKHCRITMKIFIALLQHSALYHSVALHCTVLRQGGRVDSYPCDGCLKTCAYALHHSLINTGIRSGASARDVNNWMMSVLRISHQISPA